MKSHTILKKVATTILTMVFITTAVLLAYVPKVEAQLPLPPGVPRGDVLIMGKEYYGANPDPFNFNYIVPGNPSPGDKGYSQLCAAYLWYVNTTSAAIISWLAASPPEYSQDFKTITIRLRQGVYWNDGHPFTADDVVYTIKLYSTDSRTTYYTTFSEWVEDVNKIDNYTIIIKLKNSNPRFHYFLTVIIYDTAPILPKHVWEKTDVMTFKNYPPVCIGPYNLKAVDSGGLWFLWERYEAWWGTKLYGMRPAPKYVLVISYGTEEKDALAMSKHELDSTIAFSPENFEFVWKTIPEYVGVWRNQPPYAWPFDACVKGVIFNVLKYPFNLTEVRKAIIHALDYRILIDAFKGPDGAMPIPTVLPIVRYVHAEPRFYIPLKDELMKLGLDPDPPMEIVSYLKPLGFDPAIVWYRHDTEESERLLKSVGLYRGPDNLWRLPTGEIWTVELFYNVEEPGFPKMAAVVTDQLERFGIKVEPRSVDTGTYWTKYARGDFGFGLGYPGCSLLDDLLPHIMSWNSKYFNPEFPETGWAGYKFPERQELDEILDTIERTPPWKEEALLELYRKALLIWAKQLPWAGFFPIPFYSAYNSYCWENWPSYPENYYMDPVYWWAQMQFIVLQLRPSGKCPIEEATTPGKPPILPLEMPTPTPTPATTITVIVATTVSTTVVSTATVTQTVTEWTTTTVLAVVLALVGLIIGRLTKKGRGESKAT